MEGSSFFIVVRGFCVIFGLMPVIYTKSKYKFFKLVLLITLSFSILSTVSAQVHLYGTVTDEVTGKPISFAAISETGTTNGCVSDIDGKFSLTVNRLPAGFSVTLIGYQSKKFSVDKTPINIQLKPSEYELKEATIRPGKNPADDIIKRVIAHRDSLNPDNLSSYIYTTYNKTVFNGKKDTVVNPLQNLLGGGVDSTSIMFENILNRQYLFINESVTEKKYRKPGNYHEKIIASRTSGMEDPMFSTLTTQLQSISFYENTSVKVLGNEYNNPLADDAFSTYKYEIADTNFSKGDTIIVISFQPKAGKKQKAMAGFLHINMKYFALESAMASPVISTQSDILIRHQYQRFEDGHWFPSQLSIDVKMNRMKIGGHHIVIEAKTYIKNVEINPEIKWREFGALEVEVDQKATKNQADILPLYREDHLTKKDSATYTTIDSVAKELKLEKRIDFLEAALEGKIRISVLDIPLDKIISYNNYEGIRLGIGLETNHRMLKWMRLGGYFAYGFNDKAIKYGGFVEFLPYHKMDIRIRFDYKRDVFFSGFTDFPISGPILLSNATSQYVLNVFDSIQLFEGSFSVRPVLNWQIRFAMNHQMMDPTRDYRFLPDTSGNQHYNLTEINLTTRWAIKEKYLAFGRRYIAKPTKFPVLFFHITQSLPGLGGEFSYTKLMGRITQNFYIHKLGKTTASFEGGYIFGEAPYGKLFANRGSFANFSIVSRNSFETMRANEFLMDSYVALYFSHNFGTLFKVKNFIKPELSIVHNLGFGWLRTPERHTGIEFKSMHGGFFEGGIVLDNVLVISNIGFGAGVFYRYGSTASMDPGQNVYVKMALTTGF